MAKKHQHFVFLSVTDHRGVQRDFYLKRTVLDTEILWTEDRSKKEMMSEAEASNLASDWNAGCGFES